jgi:hypothetical protein
MTYTEANKIINALKNLREELSDEKALDYTVLYPSWKTNKELKLGDRVKHNERLYKVIQEHITQSDWTPDKALTLFEPIDLVNEGSMSKPIVAAIGMTYFKDKYYLDETTGKIYLCTRDDSNGNGTILYHVPSALIGLYFTTVE